MERRLSAILAGDVVGYSRLMEQDEVVFPSVVKAGFLFGGEFGTGALREHGQTAGYYNIAAASYGLQIGVQSFGYALFLMNGKAMSFLNSQGGWQVGVGPSVVVMDQGMAPQLHERDRDGRRLCLHFRPAGPDGWYGAAGLQDHPVHAGQLNAMEA